ncbi:MAG TPA: ZIP family metal transporter [Thermoplasmata archaeon]|nr:ZIP family metal transporter [Thermoplasmata archaeon]
MVDSSQLLLWAAITGGTPLIIALIPLAKARVSDRTTHVMLGLSAGILLSIALVNILPESLELGGAFQVPVHLVAVAAAIGFLALLLLERTLLAEGKGGHIDVEGRKIQPFGTLALSALTIHGLLDGFVIPLGLEAGGGVAVVVPVAVALHQIPDSFAAASVSLGSSGNPRTALAFILATAIDTPIGIGIGLLFLGAGQAWLPFGLAFSAGTFLFVSAADLIPELQHRARSLLVTGSILAGVAGVVALTLLLPPA